MAKLNNRDKGNAAETTAAIFLCRKGYQVITRNYYTRKGEIDLICFKDESYRFIEVKSLHHENGLEITEQLTSRKIGRIHQCARYWLSKEQLTEVNWIIEFIGIVYLEYPGKIRKIVHIPLLFA